MELTTTIYDLVIFFPHSIDIFDRYNLDYYCNGSKPFLKSCEEKNIDPRCVWEEIKKTRYAPTNLNHSLEEWSPEFLTSVILQHYCNLGGTIPRIKQLLKDGLERCVKDERKKIHQIFTCFNDLAEAVAEHSASEERVFLRTLESLPKNKWSDIPLAAMKHEHMYIGSLVNTLRQITSNYDPSGFLLPSANLTFIMLQQFDRELTLRLHLENNVLFPKLKEAAL